jgi:hypothetical protein
MVRITDQWSVLAVSFARRQTPSVKSEDGLAVSVIALSVGE